VQIKLTETNLANLDRFIAESKKVDPEYNVGHTALVNMIFGEKLRDILNPSKYHSVRGLLLGEELKRLERKKP
jgi:hypothetical protein